MEKREERREKREERRGKRERVETLGAKFGLGDTEVTFCCRSDVSGLLLPTVFTAKRKEREGREKTVKRKEREGRESTAKRKERKKEKKEKENRKKEKEKEKFIFIAADSQMRW